MFQLRLTLFFTHSFNETHKGVFSINFFFCVHLLLWKLISSLVVRKGALRIARWVLFSCSNVFLCKQKKKVWLNGESKWHGKYQTILWCVIIIYLHLFVAFLFLFGTVIIALTEIVESAHSTREIESKKIFCEIVFDDCKMPSKSMICFGMFFKTQRVKCREKVIASKYLS